MYNPTNNILPTFMPKLDVSRANWALFVLHFRMVVQGKELCGHFDITTPAITQEAVDIACSLLAQQISDSTLIIVSYVKIGRSSFEWISVISHTGRSLDKVWKLIQEQMWIPMRLDKIPRLWIKHGSLSTDWQCDLRQWSWPQLICCATVCHVVVILDNKILERTNE